MICYMIRPASIAVNGWTHFILILIGIFFLVCECICGRKQNTNTTHALYDFAFESFKTSKKIFELLKIYNVICYFDYKISTCKNNKYNISNVFYMYTQQQINGRQFPIVIY